MKRYINTITLCILILTLAGCSTYNINKINNFEKDSNTLKREEAWQFSALAKAENNNLDNNTETQYEQNRRSDNGIIISKYDNCVGELILVNEDKSIEWKVLDNTDIIYNDKTFYDLYKAINNIDIPYDKTSFINFIIKTYSAESKDIYIYYSVANRLSADELNDSDGIVGILDEIENLNGYNEVKNKYNQDVNWKITLMEGHESTGFLYGCSKYILYKGNDEEVTIDMSIYDSGIINEDYNIDVQSDDSIESNTEETEETEEKEETEETLIDNSNAENNEESENEESENEESETNTDIN